MREGARQPATMADTLDGRDFHPTLDGRDSLFLLDPRSWIIHSLAVVSRDDSGEEQSRHHFSYMAGVSSFVPRFLFLAYTNLT